MTCQELTQSIQKLAELNGRLDLELEASNFEQVEKTQAEIIEELKKHLYLEIGRLFELAENIMGKDYYGSEAVAKAFDIRLDEESLPPIPFTLKELYEAKKRGLKLILRVDKEADGRPLTMKRIEEILLPKFKELGVNKVFHDSTMRSWNLPPKDRWYKLKDFFHQKTCGMKWVLTTVTLSEETREEDYLEQIDTLRQSSLQIVDDESIRPKTRIKIDQFDAHRDAIAEFMEKASNLDSDRRFEQGYQYFGPWQMMSAGIVIRPHKTPVEIAYDLFIHFINTGERLMVDDIANSAEISSRFSPVTVGPFTEEGIKIFDGAFDQKSEKLGAHLTVIK